MVRKKKKEKHLDDLSRAILKHLMKNDGFGFSYEVLASMAFRRPTHRITAHQVAAVRSFFYRHGHKVTMWRNALTTKSHEFIVSRSKLPKRRSRRRRAA
jgi:hypothetical protein